jgi:hypothetical protein
VHNLVDAASRRGDGLREALPGDAPRGGDLLEMDFPGMDRVVCGCQGVSPLVAVGNLDIGGSGRHPGEAGGLLVVDGLGSIEDQQRAVRNLLEVGAEFAEGMQSLPDEFGLLIRE